MAYTDRGAFGASGGREAGGEGETGMKKRCQCCYGTGKCCWAENTHALVAAAYVISFSSPGNLSVLLKPKAAHIRKISST